MKITIASEGEYYILYKEKEHRPIKNFRANQINSPFAFYDEDIENLIGEKSFNSTWLNGKYDYNISLNHLKLITGERGATNRTELEMYKN